MSDPALTSALTPAGPQAAMIAKLWWLMLGVFGAILLLVVALLAWGALRRRARHEPRPPFGDAGFIVMGGIVLPLVVLVPLLVYSLADTGELTEPRTVGRTIRVTGHMWWWDVRYPDDGIALANEIVIPTGEPVRIELTSADVIHSLWVPSLAGKTDATPGLTTSQILQADRAGVYRGACAEFCGLQHAKMALLVVALEPAAFREWLVARRSPPPAPTDPLLASGLATFVEAGCAECHTIRGTAAAGSVGPDLTHIASRRTLGAGAVVNNHGNLAGWIVGPQALKPGNQMPATTLAPERLHALVAYLRSLP